MENEEQSLEYRKFRFIMDMCKNYPLRIYSAYLPVL
jgi:hypothetical protein